MGLLVRRVDEAFDGHGLLEGDAGIIALSPGHPDVHVARAPRPARGEEELEAVRRDLGAAVLDSVVDLVDGLGVAEGDGVPLLVPPALSASDPESPLGVWPRTKYRVKPSAERLGPPSQSPVFSSLRGLTFAKRSPLDERHATYRSAQPLPGRRETK